MANCRCEQLAGIAFNIKKHDYDTTTENRRVVAVAYEVEGASIH